MEAFAINLQNFFATAFAGMLAAGGLVLVFGLFLIGLFMAFFFRIYIAYRMAQNRHREPLPWVLLSFCFSPVITWIILLIFGDKKESDNW